MNPKLPVYSYDRTSRPPSDRMVRAPGSLDFGRLRYVGKAVMMSAKCATPIDRVVVSGEEG